MRVIEPYHFQKPRYKKKFNALKIPIYFGLAVLIALLILGGVLYYLPLPKLQAQASEVKVPAQSVTIKWPTYGQSAIGAVGYGLLEYQGNGQPAPIASVTKVVTAMAILEKKPLTPTDTGPVITFTPADAELFRQYLAKNGSVVPANAGSSMTQRQAIESILLASANNIADTTAIWAFGSLDAYTDYANAMVKKLGMNSTTISDASGFSPNTVSTASDLIMLGQALMKEPLLNQIVAQKTAQLPIGIINNTNRALGINGTIGIKTGNTDEAGGCYLIAVQRLVEGQSITVIGAVLGATTLTRAINDALSMTDSAFSGFGLRKVVNKGQDVGHYNLPNEQQLLAIASDDISVFGWLNKEQSAQVKLDNITYPTQAGKQIGIVTVGSLEVPVLAGSSVEQPSMRSRFTRWL